MKLGGEFRYIFGITMTEAATRMNRSKESVSMCFRGAPAGFELLESLTTILREEAEKQYKADIATAEYKHKKALELIQYLEQRQMKEYADKWRKRHKNE